MEHGYFEHGADVGIVGRGRTVPEAFASAAGAMFAVMVEPREVPARASLAFEFDEDDDAIALVTLLNRLLSEARLRGLALGRFVVERAGRRWRVHARGAPWDRAMERGVEVKGATFTGLRVEEKDGAVEARCVVDV